MRLSCLCCVSGVVLIASGMLSAQEAARLSHPIVAGVKSAQLLDPDQHATEWLTYSGQYHARRFSKLSQINRENVSGLRLKWIRQFPVLEAIETSPLVVKGIMYITLPENKVLAFDVTTGLRIWEYQYPLPADLVICCGKVNRGLAILGDTLYMGTLDAHLVAIDARTGKQLWKTQVIDHKKGYSITGAPLVVKDLVITGIAGGEFGIRGFLDAYDAATGQLRWRRYTIPGPNEPGHETWEGDSWQHGGAPTWITGAYDPELDLLYWGVGNPGPDFNGEVRPGDNLYSDCVLALRPDTGEIRWHFQFTPHDVHDWDACQVPILADLDWQGQPRKLMLWANRNGFFYVLDRVNGEFLLGKPFAQQTWAEPELDPKGRPIRISGMLPSREGVFVAPDVSGAANWWSPSFSPQTGLYYVMAFDGGAKYFLGEETFKEGQFYGGGAADRLNEVLEFPDSSFASAVRAIDPLTGERRWEYPVETKSTSGLLTTQGGLLFGGTAKGSFFALDVQDGKELWKLDLGGRVHAAPITYQADDRQYVTIAAGSALFTFGL